MSLSELWEMVMDREAWYAAIHGVAKSWTQLSNWTELKVITLTFPVGEVFKFKMATYIDGASLLAQLVKNPPVLHETPVWFLVGKIRWRRDSLPSPVFLGFPGGSVSKESACNAGDLVLIPGLERFPEGGQGFQLVLVVKNLPANTGDRRDMYLIPG